MTVSKLIEKLQAQENAGRGGFPVVFTTDGVVMTVRNVDEYTPFDCDDDAQDWVIIEGTEF